MPGNKNHGTLSQTSWISKGFPMLSQRWKCGPQHQHKVQSGSACGLCFSSLRETSVTEQRQSVGRAGNLLPLTKSSSESKHQGK